jgi:hypothetical protein
VAAPAAVAAVLGLAGAPASAAPYSHTETVTWNIGSCSVTHTWEETATAVDISISGTGGPCATPDAMIVLIYVDQVYPTGGRNGPFSSWDMVTTAGDPLRATLTVLKHDEAFRPVEVEGIVEISCRTESCGIPSEGDVGNKVWDVPSETSPK